jgi:hypothetical protein
MSIDAVEHAGLIGALCAAVAALDENGLYQEASTARAVLHELVIAAVHQPSERRDPRLILEFSHRSAHSVRLMAAKVAAFAARSRL